jgi:hypothetical protein
MSTVLAGTMGIFLIPMAIDPVEGQAFVLTREGGRDLSRLP